jgi:acyl-CoA thioesterase II
MGNALPIAYGGFAVAAAVKAGYLSLPNDSYHLYTCMGSFLGPAQTDRPLRSKVTVIRQTRTFATRQITVSQIQNDGTDRACLVALADFQVAEPESLLEYSVTPAHDYSHWTKCVPWQVRGPQMVKEAKVTQAMADAQLAAFGVMHRSFETLPCPEGIFAQNIYGMAKNIRTTQHDLPVPKRSTADWIRMQFQLPNETENIAALAFYMDGAMAFLPLSVNNMFLDDSGAASSLDFSLRVFSNDIDMRKWHLREIQTLVASEGRTYSEARIFDEGGKCVAAMTESCICRPLKKAKKTKGKL